MRQAGVLAAAAMYSLDHVLPKLSEEHEKTQHIIQGMFSVFEWHTERADILTSFLFMRFYDKNNFFFVHRIESLFFMSSVFNQCYKSKFILLGNYVMY